MRDSFEFCIETRLDIHVSIIMMPSILLYLKMYSNVVSKKIRHKTPIQAFSTNPIHSWELVSQSRF